MKIAKTFKIFLKDIIKHSNKCIFFSKKDKIIYRTTHSLITLSIFMIVIYVKNIESFFGIFLAYLSHIIIDIFTHNNEFSTRILFPFSDFHIEGKFWLKNKKMFINIWLITIIIFIFVILS